MSSALYMSLDVFPGNDSHGEVRLLLMLMKVINCAVIVNVIKIMQNYHCIMLRFI